MAALAGLWGWLPRNGRLQTAMICNSQKVDRKKNVDDRAVCLIVE